MAILSLVGGTGAGAVAFGTSGPSAKPIDVPAGTSAVSVTLAQLGLGYVPALQRGTESSLAQLTTTASTLSDALSALAITGVTADGTSYADHEVRSGDERSKVERDEPRDINRPGAKLDLAIGGWAAEADHAADSAAARLGVLSGSLQSNKIGLRSSIGERGLFSEVDKDGAEAHAAVTIDGFGMNFGALLPVDLVALPFGMTLEMVERLEIPLPEDLAGDVDRFLGVVDRLQVIDNTLSLLHEARSRLEDRVEDEPEFADALDAVDLAGDLLAAAKADLAGAQSQLADAEAALEDATAALADAQAELAAAEAVLTAAQADVATIENEIAALDAEIAELESDPVEAIANADEIAAKLAQRAALVEELEAAQAAEEAAQDEVDAAQAEVDAAAAAEVDARTVRDARRAAVNAAGSAVDSARARLATAETAYQTITDALAAADEEIAGLRDDVIALKAHLAALLMDLRPVLDSLRDLAGLHEGILDALDATPVLKVGALHLVAGTKVDADGPVTQAVCEITGMEVLGKPLPAVTCEDFVGLREGIQNRLVDLLSLLAGKTVEGVVIDGPRPTVTAAEEPDAEGFVSAKVAFTPFKLQVPSVELADVANDVKDNLETMLDRLLNDPELESMPEFVSVPDAPLAEMPVLALGLPSAAVAGGGDMRVMAPSDAVNKMLESLEDEAEQVPDPDVPSASTSAAGVEFGAVSADSTYRAAGFGGSGNGGDALNGGSGSDSEDDTDGTGGRPGLGEGGVGSGEHSDLIGGGDVPVGVALPHTGGGASAALAGLALLSGAAVLRRRREA